MLHNVPDWATRHGYWHHSNPRSKDRAKTLYEKVHVRPQIEKAFETLRDKNATDADKLLAKGELPKETTHSNLVLPQHLHSDL